MSSQNKGIFTPEGNIHPFPPTVTVHNTSKKGSFESTGLFYFIIFFPLSQDFKDPKTNPLLGVKIKELCPSFPPRVAVKRMFFPSIWHKVGGLHPMLIAGL